MRNLKIVLIITGGLFFILYLLANGYIIRRSREYDEKSQIDYQEPQNDHQEPQNYHHKPHSDHQEPHNDHLEPQNDHQEPQNDRPSNKSRKKFIPLPSSDFKQVKTFVFFLGHQRSGHSIVGSLLDAHPHIIMAHEDTLFLKLSEDLSSKMPQFNNKFQIFNELWRNSFRSSTSGLRTEKGEALTKGYTLAINGLYQGTFVPPIQVIGDKSGGRTTLMFITEPIRWKEVFFKLKSLLDNISIKVIHVIRNPYDNIATKALYKSKARKKVTKVKYGNISYEIDDSLMKQQINEYFEMFQAIQQIKHKYDLNFLEVHGKDLIENPKTTILNMCRFLGVLCSDDYLKICINKLFKTESKTRYKLVWTKQFISTVQESIINFDNLKRYSFDS